MVRATIGLFGSMCLQMFFIVRHRTMAFPPTLPERNPRTGYHEREIKSGEAVFTHRYKDRILSGDRRTCALLRCLVAQEDEQTS